jgi:hypothetical protein
MRGGMIVSMAAGMIEIGTTGRLGIIAERGKNIVVVRGTTGGTEMARIGTMRGTGSPVVSEKITEIDANGIENLIEIASRRGGESVPRVVMNAATVVVVTTSEIIDEPMTEGEMEITAIDVGEKTMTDHPADAKNPMTRKTIDRVVDVLPPPTLNPPPKKMINPKKSPAHEKNPLPAAADHPHRPALHLLLQSPVIILAGDDRPHKPLPVEAVLDPAHLHHPVAVSETDISLRIDPQRRLLRERILRRRKSRVVRDGIVLDVRNGGRLLSGVQRGLPLFRRGVVRVALCGRRNLGTLRKRYNPGFRGGS